MEGKSQTYIKSLKKSKVRWLKKVNLNEKEIETIHRRRPDWSEGYSWRRTHDIHSNALKNMGRKDRIELHIPAVL